MSLEITVNLMNRTAENKTKGSNIFLNLINDNTETLRRSARAKWKTNPSKMIKVGFQKKEANDRNMERYLYVCILIDNI